MIKRIAIIVMTAVFLFTAPSLFAKGESIVKVNADVDIPNDMVASDVVVIDGNATVAGRVEGSLVTVGGSAILKAGSYVGQQVVVVGGELKKDPAAQVQGKITLIDMPRIIPRLTGFLKGGWGNWIALWATISVMALLGFLGLAVLLAALIPEHVGTAVNAMERSFIGMFIWGILWMVLIIPIAVLLAVSIVGIILIPLEILLVALALIIGYIVSAIYIGKNVLLAFKKVSLPFVDAILGILILFVIGLVPVIGPAVRVLFLVAGFGAVLTTRFGTIK